MPTGNPGTDAATVVALAYQRATATIIGRLSLVLATLWRGVDVRDAPAAWAQVLPQAVGAFTAAQDAAAGMADSYAGRALAAQAPGLTARVRAAAARELATAGRAAAARVLSDAGVGPSALDQLTDLSVDPTAFSGVTASGLSLEDLLSIPAQRAGAAIAAGAQAADVARAGQASLTMYATTEVADAARSAASVASVTRGSAGYIREVGPFCCSRCALLSGRFYRHSAGFLRHPNCFPAGVVVSGPGADAVTKRWYEGELVIITTSDGQDLPVTPNHPILTRHGWVPAGLLNEGDHLIRSLSGPGQPVAPVHLPVPDEQHMPSEIQDLWRPDGMLGVARVVGAAHDFHGDGFDSEVHIVPTQGLLGHGSNAALFEPLAHDTFSIGNEAVEWVVGGTGFSQERPPGELLGIALKAREPGAASREGFAREARPGQRRDALLALLGGHPVEPETRSLLRAASWHSGLIHALHEGDLRHPVAAPEDGGALSGEVGADGLLERKSLRLLRWDAPSGPLSVETYAAYAERGCNLLDRLAGKVELDRVIQLRRVSFSGHVYNLSTREGWFSANGLIVSNCRCVNVPTAGEIAPADLPSSIDLYRQGRITDLTRAEREALDLGADISQVINAKKGLYIAGGQQYTTVGTTRQGIAGARILARDIARAQGAPAGRTYVNYAISRQQVAQATARYGPMMRAGLPFRRSAPLGGETTSAYRLTRTTRPSVATIMRTSTSKDDAVTQLINSGYLIDPKAAATSTHALERMFRTG